MPRNGSGNAIVRLPNLRSEDNEGQETLLVAPYTDNQIYIYIYIYIYRNLIEIIQNLQICYLKFQGMNDHFQAILKLSHNSNTLILDKVWHIAIATNCHLSFTNHPVGLLYN